VPYVVGYSHDQQRVPSKIHGSRLDPSGRSIAVQGLTIYYVADGRITGHRQVVDRLSVVQQRGLMG
jgi:predicted ester cyclase